jgi:DNA-binding response OmpR family regulator
MHAGPVVSLIIVIFLMSQAAAAPVSSSPSPEVPKIVVVTLAYDNDAVKEISTEIQYGTAPGLDIQSGSIEGRLLDDRKSTLGEFSIRDPRMQVGDAISRGAEGEAIGIAGYTRYNPDARFRLVVPFVAGLHYISLVDTISGNTLVTIDLASSLTAFGRANPADPDVGRSSGQNPQGIPLFVWEVFAIAGFVAVMLAGIAYRALGRMPRPIRIMVVDDEPALIDLFIHFLTFKEYVPVTAQSGKECLDILRSDAPNPDLILLDIGMRDMDGWQTLEEIKKNPVWKKIPVLMLTGRQPTPAEAKRYGLCIDDYLLKPVDPKELYSVIEYVLNRRQDIEQDIHAAINAGYAKDMVCEYARLKKRVEVEKKLKGILRTPDEAEIPSGIQPLTRDEVAAEMRSHEEKLKDLESRLSPVLSGHHARKKLTGS